MKAHTHTNKLTSIIYALTLGCVIFLCVSLNLLIETINASNSYPDCDIAVYGGDYNDYGTMLANKTDPILLQYASSIKNFA